MRCDALLEKIDELTPAYIKVWQDVCNIESPTKHKEGVDAVSSYLINLAQGRGWEIEIHEHPIAGNAVSITMNPDAEGDPICLSGHIDTVHPVGSFGSPAVRIEGEKIYGPGVTDCKGGVVAGFLAMDALREIGFTERPVRMLLQSDEEVGSSLSGRETINFICEKARDAVAFLNLEGHTAGNACLVRKGILTFTFTVTGKEAHSSACAKSGANAILDAAYKIIELEKIKDNEGLTCCCSVISGGTVTNTVPKECQFKANVRFATREQEEWIREHVQKIAETIHVPGCTCKVNQPRGRVAMELCARNEALLEEMNRIYAEYQLPILKADKRAGGSDAADVTLAGIPCIDSIGTEGGRIHTIEEFAHLASLGESAKRIAPIIYSWKS